MVLQPLLFALKGIHQVKYEKILMVMGVSLLFHNIGPNLAPNFVPRPNQIWFLAGFQLNMIGNSINIKNFYWNPLVLKKNLLKPLKNTSFWPTCAKKGSPWTTPKTNNFFSAVAKPDHKLSKTFYFNKISYVLAELSMFFYFIMFFFFAKNYHFQP